MLLNCQNAYKYISIISLFIAPYVYIYIYIYIYFEFTFSTAYNTEVYNDKMRPYFAHTHKHDVVRNNKCNTFLYEVT